MVRFWGKVIHGKKQGKSFGFPTANMALHKPIAEGIYISKTKINGKLYASATFIGPARMFGENNTKAETYILHFQQNIYDTWITVTLLKKIRNNEVFSSEQALIAQMHDDIQKVKEYFSNAESALQ